MIFRRLLTTAAAAACVITLQAQDAPAPAKPESPAEFKALKYRNIGPAAGGRVSRVSGVPRTPKRYYAPTPPGGGWVSDDGGPNFKTDLCQPPDSPVRPHS